MSCYYVEWRIEVEADSAEEAARKALAIQRNPDSIATVFHVYGDRADGSIQPQQIDLSDEIYFMSNSYTEKQKAEIEKQPNQTLIPNVITPAAQEFDLTELDQGVAP